MEKLNELSGQPDSSLAPAMLCRGCPHRHPAAPPRRAWYVSSRNKCFNVVLGCQAHPLMSQPREISRNYW